MASLPSNEEIGALIFESLENHGCVVITPEILAGDNGDLTKLMKKAESMHPPIFSLTDDNKIHSNKEDRIVSIEETIDALNQWNGFVTIVLEIYKLNHKLANKYRDENKLVKELIAELSKQGKLESMDYEHDPAFPIEKNIADLISILIGYGYRVELDA